MSIKLATQNKMKSQELGISLTQMERPFGTLETKRR